MPKIKRGQALVIGGSIAGLCAARVLSEHFEYVTIVDRDRFDDATEYRSGVPQGRHIHVMLGRGRRLMNTLFPGLDAECEAAGVPLLNVGRDMELVSIGGKAPRYTSEIELRSSSRGWLEAALRRRVLALPGIRLLTSVEVTGLHVADGGTIDGVEIKRRDGLHEQLQAELTVDASGRASKVTDWLQTLGYPAPDVTTVNAHLGYVTRWYRQPSTQRTTWRGALTGNRPTTNSRGGVLLPIEGDRLMVTLVGIADQQPEVNEAAFLDCARQLISPSIYELIKDLEPVSPVYGYRATQNRWVHFERLARWPEGFVVLGDAACCFNPVHGQGMTVSALEAELLGETLRKQGRSLRGFSRRFQRRLPKVLQAAWTLSTAEDYRWPTTEGGKPSASARFAHWDVDRLVEVMQDNAAMVETFLTVHHLLRPPTALFRPGLVVPVVALLARKLLAAASLVRHPLDPPSPAQPTPGPTPITTGA
ncbi:MAG: FAD-dependent monooxygenase [Polyangiales bacterium]